MVESQAKSLIPGAKWPRCRDSPMKDGGGTGCTAMQSPTPPNPNPKQRAEDTSLALARRPPFPCAHCAPLPTEPVDCPSSHPFPHCQRGKEEG